MWLVAVIQAEIVEHPTTGLLTDVLVNYLAPDLGETDSVGERFGAGLHCEGSLDVSQGKSEHFLVS